MQDPSGTAAGPPELGGGLFQCRDRLGHGRRGPPAEACPARTVALSCGHAGRFGSACGAAGGHPLCRAAAAASSPGTLGAPASGADCPGLSPGIVAGRVCCLPPAPPRHSCLPRCAPSEEGDSSPLSSLSHKYLGAAGQLAGTGPTPVCQIRPAVPVTHRPSAALLTCCRQLLFLGPAGKGAGAGGREGATAKFSDNASPPGRFPPVACSRGPGLTAKATRGCPARWGQRCVAACSGACSRGIPGSSFQAGEDCPRG